MVRSPVSTRSCFGYSSRESGQRRVPAPPERMTGISMPSRKYSSSGRRDLAAADGIVGKPEAGHHARIVEVAAVKDHRRRQKLLQPLEVGTPEFLPFRNDGQGVGSSGRLVGALANNEIGTLPVDADGFVQGDRVVDTHVGAGL